MLCKKCDYPYSYTVYTKHDDIKNTTSRRRECIRCGERFTTIENHKNSIENYFKEIGK